MPKAPKTSPQKVRSTVRSRAALDLRAQGFSYSDIADRLGIGRSTAHRYVTQELAYLAQECREEAVHVRDLELQRLDDLYLIAYRAIIDGYDLPAIDRCLRIMERRAKLLGLDAAQKVDVQGLMEIHFDKEDEDL